MFLQTDITKTWQILTHPDQFFDAERSRGGYWPIFRFFLLLNLLLACLTPLMIWLGFPANIVHAGTNAQMGSYLYAPFLEAVTGITRYLWIGLLTFLLNILKFPLIGLIYHLIAKILRGTGTLLDSFKVGIYAVAPTLLFGWIPYFALISGLWAGYLYVVALNQLHNTSLGPTIALINTFIGIQIVWAFTFGWFTTPAP